MLAKLRARLSAWLDHHLKLGLNLYPPYLGTGIHVAEIAPDLRSLRVVMHLRFYNRNYVGTHFGGSLYAMCDPFFMLMVINNLGPRQLRSSRPCGALRREAAQFVWDKEARIRVDKRIYVRLKPAGPSAAA